MGSGIVDAVLYVEEGLLVTAPLPLVETDELEDVQSARDHREIAIEQVGVSDLQYPITVLDRAQEKQQVVLKNCCFE